MVNWNFFKLVVFQSLSLCLTLQLHGLQHTRLTCPLLSSRVCSSSCPLSQWYHPTISFSISTFSSCLQTFLASVSFPVSWLFASGGQSIGVCTSASVLLMNIQGWFPLGLTGLISLQSKWFLRIFSSTITVHKLQFFSAQPCLWSISHIHTLLLIALAVWTCGHICFLNMLSRFIKLCLINAKKEVSESKRESKVHKQYRVEYGT